MSIGNKLTAVKTVVTSKAGLSLLKGQKHSPTIMFAAGVIGFGATVVLASKATLKLSDVLEKTENERNNAHDLHELGRLGKADYNPKQYKRDTAAIKISFVKDVTRLYAPAAIVGVASVAALTGSHVVLNRRYTSAVAAYATLDKSFREYQERVKELAPDLDQKKLLNGVEAREIVEEGPNGPEVKTVYESAGKSPYAVLFAKDTTQEWSPQSDYNLVFLRSNQSWANDQLKAKGYLFLNDVYEQLGLPRIPAGQAVGWVKDNKKVYEDGRVGGDNFVSFGIDDDRDRFYEFMAGKDGAIWLDFNVDGVIYDLI